MLTLEMLKEMAPDTVFAQGTVSEDSQPMHWFAQRGGIEDWAICYGPIDWPDGKVLSQGAKFFSEDKIKLLVPCDDEAFKMYRY